jgi:hypothetical protein
MEEQELTAHSVFIFLFIKNIQLLLLNQNKLEGFLWEPSSLDGWLQMTMKTSSYTGSKEMAKP